MNEQSRRGRINKKLRALQELLPNCDKVSLNHRYLVIVSLTRLIIFTWSSMMKVDQAGVLDKAIEYLKTLQQQLLVKFQKNSP